MKRTNPPSAEPSESSSGSAERTESGSDDSAGVAAEAKTEAGTVPIPPILLEGDEPRAVPSAGPGEKFATSTESEAPAPAAGSAELPGSYGTGRLLLTARDPRCLYAHWDIDPEEQREQHHDWAHHHMVLRVHEESLSGPVIAEQHVPAGSRHTFVAVDSPSGRYVAQLGYYPSDRPWQAVAASETAVTPVEPRTDQGPIQFATLGFPIPASPQTVSPPLPAAPLLPKVIEETAGPDPRPGLEPALSHSSVPSTGLGLEFPLVRTAAATPEASIAPARPLISDLEPDEEEFGVSWPAAPGSQRELPWTPAQQRALAEVIGWSVIRQKRIGSAELAALLQGQRDWSEILTPGEVSSMAAAALSSEAAGPQPSGKPQGFWLNVNAELVVYGATEPGSILTIGGRPIQLRPDGTFSFRFALPDGTYSLPVAAVSSHGEVRGVELGFSRSTVCSGEVGSEPQDPELAPPKADNVS